MSAATLTPEKGASLPGSELLAGLVQAVVAKESKRLQEAIIQEARGFEVEISRAQATRQRPSCLPALRQYSQNVEVLQMQLLQMEHQKRRRSMEVGGLRKALKEARKVMLGDSVPDQAKGEVAASQLLAEIRDEREQRRWEKRRLEEEIKELEAELFSDQGKASAEPATDPEKEKLKHTVKQLQMSIESRDHYACWICNQRATQEVSEESCDQEELERQNSEEMNADDEAAAMRSEISKMRAELRRLRGSTCSQSSRTSGKSPRASLAKSPRASVAKSPGNSIASLAQQPAKDLPPPAAQPGRGSCSSTDEQPRVRFSASCSSVSEMEPAPGALMRSSRARVPTPHVSPELIDVMAVQAPREEGQRSQVRSVEFRGMVNTEELPGPAVMRSARGRVPTPFVSPETLREVAAEAVVTNAGAADRAVHFSSEVSAEALPTVPGARTSRGRVPTPFVSPEALQELAQEVPPRVQFTSGSVSVTETEPLSDMPMRTSRARIPTPFVSAELVASASGQAGPEEVGSQQEKAVHFTSEVSIAALTEVAGARSFRGRIPTPFVTPEALEDLTREARPQVRLSVQATTVEEVEDPGTSGPTRTSRNRIPTPFVSSEMLMAVTASGSDAPGTARPAVSFAEAVSTEFQELSADSQGRPMRPTRSRIATPFLAPDLLLETDAPPDRTVSFRDPAEPSASKEPDDGAPAGELPAGNARSCRGRIATPFVSPECLLQEAAQVQAAVRFHEPEEDSSSPAVVDGARSVRSRTPTGFVRADIVEAGVRFADGHATDSANGSGCVEAPHVRSRVPTGFVHADDLGASVEAPFPGNAVTFREEPDVVETVAASEPAVQQLRSARLRTPTGYVRACDELDPGGGVRFADSADGADAADSTAVARGVRFAAAAAPANGPRSVRTRTPTGFVRGEDLAGDDSSEGRCVRFGDAEPSVVEVAAAASVGAEALRSVRQRVPTGYVGADLAAPQEAGMCSADFAAPATSALGSGGRSEGRAVTFSEGPQPVEEVEASGTAGSELRSVRARTPTGYVGPETVPERSAGVRFAAPEEVSAASSAAGSARSARGRTPTGFVRDAEVRTESSALGDGLEASASDAQQAAAVEFPQGAVAENRTVTFRERQESVMEFSVGDDAVAEMRQVRTRTPTGFVAADPAAARGVRFGPAESDVGAADGAPLGQVRTVKSRTPTGFVRAEGVPKESAGISFAGGESTEEAISMVPAEETLGMKTNQPTGFMRPCEDLAEPESMHGRTVTFRERQESIVEFNVGGEEAAAAMRPVRTREPTGYVAAVPEAKAGRGVCFAADNEEAEAASEAAAEDVPVSGGASFAVGQDAADGASVEPAGDMRSVKERAPTGFIRSGKRPGEAGSTQHCKTVTFRDRQESVVEFSVGSEEPAAQMRQVRTRTPTGYVGAGADGGAHLVDDAEARSKVRFAAEELGSAEARKAKSRTPTGFVRVEDVPVERGGVRFTTGPEEAEPGSPEGSEEARTVKSRTPTGFVRLDDIPMESGGSTSKKVTFRKQESIIDIAGQGNHEEHEARSVRTRTPTGAVRTSDARMEAGVSFATGEGLVEVVDVPAAGPAPRPVKARQATGFVRGEEVGVRFSESAEGPLTAAAAKRPESPAETEESTRPGDPEEGEESHSDAETVSSCSSRNPRSRMSTPFLSATNLGLDPAGALASPGSEAGEGRRRGSKKSSSAERTETCSSFSSVADRLVLKQASLESSIEREISERVRLHAQRQAREDRVILVNSSGNAAAAATQPTLAQGTSASPEQDLEKHLVPGVAKDTELAMTALHKLPFFEEFSEEAVQVLVEAMEVYEFEDGDEVVRQGDTDGTHFFVVAAGEFVVLKDGRPHCGIGPGNSFGESVLLLFGERTATVCAQGRATAYGMEGMTVRDMLQSHYEQKRSAVMEAVDEVLNSGACDILAYLNNAYQLQSLYDQAVMRSFEQGETLMAEGPGSCDEVMVHLRGKVAARARGVELNLVERFALLGDRALLFGEQPLTLVAQDRTEVLILKKGLLQSLFGDELPKVFVRSRILALLARHSIFSRLHEEQREALASGCEVLMLRADEELTVQDLRFVAILHGEVETRIIDEGPSPEVRRYSGASMSSLGEENLLRRNKPWALWVRATGATSCVQMAIWHSKDLDNIIKIDDNLDSALEQEDRVRILKSLIIFRTLPRQQLQRIARALEISHFDVGERIFEQGEIGTHLYMIRKGVVLIEIDRRKIRTYGMGDYFGERALLSSEPRSATVTATENTELWRIDKETFQETVRGPCLEYLTARIALQDTKVTFGDLEFLRVIGRGGFGVVKLVRSRRTGVRYALKCVRKRHIVEHGAQKALITELSIQKELDHPFIVKFVRGFRSPKQVYFLMEVVTGGELLDALDKLGILNHYQAQFYTGSILLALEFLHARQIAYLDLKSENCLIDHQGYLKIIDFGIAQRITRSRCHVMLGTPIIMAPEMISGKGYTTVADLWSLGVCLYDFVIGQFPFGNNCTNKMQIFQEILHAELRFPPGFQERPHGEAAMSLIAGLLTREPVRRMGAGFEGYSSIKHHAFFAAFDWEQLLGRELTPPFLPAGETYGEDRELAGQAPQERLSTLLLADEEAANPHPEDVDWADLSPGWDADFDF